MSLKPLMTPPIVVGALLFFAPPTDACASPRSVDPPAVIAFYRHPEHCAYMASPPENDSPGFIQRFETDVKAATNALRTMNPSWSLTKALFHLKAGCDQALSKAK